MADDITPESRPWMRQEGESEPAWEAFRVYMRTREVTETARQLSKARSTVQKWSDRYDWPERIRAMDNHVQTAEVDSYADELAAVRNRHMRITDKLLDHLDHLLDKMIARGLDPSVRWTQAFVAATKAQEAALKMRPMDVAQSMRLESLAERLAHALEGPDGLE